MAALFVFCNWKLLFRRNEDISSCLRDEILKNFWSHFGSPRPGVSPTAILNDEKALGTRTVPSFVTAHTFCASRDIPVS